MIALLKSYYLLYNKEINPQKKEHLLTKIKLLIIEVTKNNFKDLENDLELAAIIKQFNE